MYVDDIILEKEKFERMWKRIHRLEITNAKTQKYSEDKVKEEIRKIIEEEVKKCY